MYGVPTGAGFWEPAPLAPIDGALVAVGGALDVVCGDGLAWAGSPPRLSRL